MKTTLAAAALLVAAHTASAQPPATGIFARGGWEAFPGVEYRGGDATQPKQRWGILVLTDTNVALYRCALTTCGDPKKSAPFKGDPLMSIALSTIKDVSSSSQVRGPGMDAKLFLGGLATDKSEEFVGIVYETASSAEAPVFKTNTAQSAAIDAKLKFRLRKLGIELSTQK